jgi:cell division protein FtsL
MNPFSLIDRRYRGFRVIEIGGLGVLLALALVVYLAKTHAGGERADIDHIQAQIEDEQARVTLLKAEVAKLEQPERLESLSGRYLKLQPVPPDHEIAASALESLAHAPPARPARAAPAPASSHTPTPVRAARVARAAAAPARAARARAAPAAADTGPPSAADTDPPT